MSPTRIAELLAPFLKPSPSDASTQLSLGQLQNISTYTDLLIRWNASISLTAIRDPEQIVTRHFGESIFAARHLFLDNQQIASKARLADLGSGAGFPGVPIKLWAPQIEVTLIESNHKKAAFLREVVRSLGLTGIRVENVRAETLAPSSFGVVTLRAVERSTSVLPIAARLLMPKGRLVAFTTRNRADFIRSTLPNFSWQSVPIPESQSRWLLISKVNQDCQ